MASPSAENQTPHGRVTSVNIGTIRQVDSNGRMVETGIFKVPTTDPQTVAGIHIGSDQQADMAAHGGADKAVYAYAAEDYSWWETQLDRELHAGLFGENLTTTGIDVSGASIGDRWTIGTAVLEVAEPRMPCFKLSIAVGVPRFQQTFGAADRPGAYLRVVSEGQLIVGDTIAVEPTTEPSLSLAEINTIYHRQHERADTLLGVPALSESWKRWAEQATNQARP